MKHKSAQFELPGTEDAFNLAGEMSVVKKTQEPVPPTDTGTINLFENQEPET